MKQKYIFSRFMATLTDLIVILLPILVWDVMILFVLSGFLPSSVMTFLDKIFKYVIFASFCITTPFITLLYGKTLGQTVFDIRIVDVTNKNASGLQRGIRELLGGLAILGCAYIYHGLAIILYGLLNLIVIILDKRSRGIMDIICHTKPIIVTAEKETVIDATKKKPQEDGVDTSLALQKSKNFYHYDLHVHSRHSIYGQDTVEELFQKAKALGIKVLSITDKFSIKSNFEAEVLSKPYGIQYIPGIEMDCQYNGYPLTILGYGIDYKDSLYVQMENEHLKLERAASVERIEKFKEATGIDLNFSKLINQTNSGIVTPEMIVKEVLNNPLYEDMEAIKPYRQDNEKAYQHLYMDYFMPKKPCFVEVAKADLKDVLEMIKSTGGIPVLAYPKKSCGDDEELLKEVLSQGVEGLEIFTSYHEDSDIKKYLQIARDAGCFVSCGSDYYGENNLLIQMGDSKAKDKHEKLLVVLIDQCLKKNQMQTKENETVEKQN